MNTHFSFDFVDFINEINDLSGIVSPSMLKTIYFIKKNIFYILPTHNQVPTCAE